MSASVAIVIVTHNRRAMLETALRACLAQPAQRIFVVNNASSDGTREYLDSLAAREPRILPRHLQENGGSAGGFAEGLRLAHAAGYEWFWLMDDDVEPVPGGLQSLLTCAKKIGAPCCLYPAKRCADGRLFDFEYKISRQTLKRWRISTLGELEYGALVPCNSGNFEGAFLHRDIVTKIGLPDARMFICWDDAFYGMQAAEYMKCLYMHTVCIKKQFDKERFCVAGKGYLGSTLFSRCHFLRNYWELMRYLKTRHELSCFAYLRYVYEFLKAVLVTVVIERNVCGIVRLCQYAKQGWQGNFTPREVRI
ncbi:MAG: glycosyltransferase [Lachnospiraceae bacterium]|nr:glycosyltransferase [Lachnospiraceae bacterium]